MCRHSPKTAATALGLSERTVRRRLHLYRRIMEGKRVPAHQKALAIPYLWKLGTPYQIPEEVVDALRRVEAVA